MKTKSVGFIGGGRVTRIFLKAFSNQVAVFESVSVYDINPEVLADLKKEFPAILTVDSVSGAADDKDIIFIALHPPVIMDTLEAMKGYIKPSAAIISLAPKITIEKIRSKAENIRKIARVIPNATSFINEGYNPVCFNNEFSGPERHLFLKMLGLLGHTFEVEESKLEAYAIISAMLPTYFWFQWKEIQQIGKQMGLTDEECSESIFETLKASLNLMYKSGLDADKVMDLIPVKPIGETESQITEIYNTRLLGLFAKIKPG